MTELQVRTPLLREALGQALRAARVAQGRTLREVSAQARVSLGYLSEIERGQKEASSELLAAVCAAMGIRLSDLLAEVTERVAAYDNLAVLRPRTATSVAA